MRALTSCLPAAVAAALGGACNYAGPGAYEPPDSSLPDAPDAPDAPPEGDCLRYWHEGTVQLAAAARIVELGSDRVDRDPYPSPDELTLYFSSERTGAEAADVFAATRVSRAAPFGTPVRQADISSVSNDSRFTMTATGLVGIVASERPASEGGSDVWIGTRASRTQPFDAFVKMNIDNVNTSGAELDPELSADGMTLYLAIGVPQRLARARRSSPNGSFSNAQEITELFSDTNDADPAISADERIVLFASRRVDLVTGGDPDGDLWFARRPDPTAELSAPIRVPGVNSDNGDADPALSADGCRLYFGSDRSGGWELYVAEVMRP